ncbi:hypothetical protein [Teredinibacter turnerae]|uniref:hypothetical protein n=1 Tax=Teredinibacter turnerae TaxID=2426 RepID=UPI0030D25805
MYDEIIQAKSNSDATLRGCVFEQLIRESLPWDFRPPMSINAKREQLDAFFEWNSWHFHVETKAKVDPITGGSHDWEDFELKVLNRKGCVGLFCSLFPVSDSLYDAAEELARKGLTIIVIEGDMWEELQRLNFGFDAYLRYMVGYVRAHRSLKVRSIEKISDEIQNRSEIEAELSSRLTADSATFLRRYKQEFHDIVYVKREIEKKLLNSLRELTPSRLKENYRKHKRSDLELERVGAPQFLVIRDIAGAGKTTLSVEFASPNDKALTIARSAVEPDIDQMMAVMKAEGDDYGLKKLLLIDKPLLLIVDSLDEAEHIHQKLSEILSLIRLVENDSKSDREPTKIKDASDLNQIAKLEGLIQFPILIVFTVRDEYWERWATLFERRNIVTHKSVISEFQANELENAIQVYESAFSFKLRNGLTPQLRTTLAVPFNLRVFAEANQFRGSINVVDAYPENVLDLFLNVKLSTLGKEVCRATSKPSLCA